MNEMIAGHLPILWAQAQPLGSAEPRAELETIPLLAWGIWLAVFFGVFPGIVAYMVWAERKVAARFQDRLGPNRVGPLGLLQPIADAIKLITKESIVPKAADRWVHLLAPILLLISAFLVLAVIPFGVLGLERNVVPFGVIDPSTTSERWYPGLVAVNLPSGLLYLFAATSLSVLGVFLAGWASRNKYSLLGAMRGVAQLVSYEIPQVLSVVPVILWTGSLSLVAIFNAQLDQGWFLFSPPGIIGFTILLISGIAETNRAPFDLPEAESEIIAGYHTEYSGMRFGLFFLAEYLAIFGVSCVVTALFLGGGTLPFLTTFLLNAFEGGGIASLVIVNAVFVGVFFLKVAFIIFLFFWIRATLPRMRVDRLMNFAWKVLIPLSIINVVVAAIWFEMVVRPAQPSAVDYLLAWGITLAILLLSIAGLFRLTRAERPELEQERGSGTTPSPHVATVP